MNLDYVRSQLSEAGWKDIHPGRHMEIDFNLVGSRRYILTNWNVLVKVLPKLDQGAVSTWKTNFEIINNKSKSLLWGKCFLLCLIAEDVSAEALQSIATDSFGLFGVVRLKSGGGSVFIADIKNKHVYGNVPSIPLDVHMYSESVKQILIATLER